jgi:hypothetical protein
MIKGKQKEELSMETILSKVSSLDIYSFFNPNKNWELNQVSLSPFKEESHPSFIIGNKYGEVGHFAFNDPDKRGDCFSFVKQIRGLSSLNDVLTVIDYEMGLGIRGIKKDYKTTVTENKKEVTKRNTLIQVKARPFTLEELAYWNQYYQSEDDLKREKIYSIEKMFLNRKRYPLEEMRFGYFYNGFWKIYQPFADKRKKWLSNIPLATTWGVENLKKDKNGLILPSKKDYMVCKKIYPYVCGVQNESLAAFSEEFVQQVKDNCNEGFYGGNSDGPGKVASYAITEAFGFKHINPEDRLLPKVKDFSDWAKVEGLNTVEQHFIKKGLIL